MYANEFVSEIGYISTPLSDVNPASSVETRTLSKTMNRMMKYLGQSITCWELKF